MRVGIAKYSVAIGIMAEPMRLTILSMIGEAGKLRGKDLLEKLDVTQPTLSHHMNVLVSAELITANKEGRCIWYSINKETMDSIAKAIMSLSEESVVTAPVAAIKRTRTVTPKATKPVAKTASRASAKPSTKTTKGSPAKPVKAAPPIEEVESVSKDKKSKDKDKDKKKKKKEKSKKKKK